MKKILVRLIFLFIPGLIFLSSTLVYASDTSSKLWVQVPQWDNDWSECAVDIPDSACHWYVSAPDSTFGDGFSWENSPWFDVNGLKDIAPISEKTVLEKLQISKLD